MNCQDSRMRAARPHLERWLVLCLFLLLSVMPTTASPAPMPSAAASAAPSPRETPAPQASGAAHETPEPHPSASPQEVPAPQESPAPHETPAPDGDPTPQPSTAASPTPDTRPLQPEPGVAPPPDAGAVEMDGHVAFYLRSTIGDLGPRRRAALINDRLAEIVNDPKAQSQGFTVGVDPTTGLPYVHHTRFTRVLFTVYPQDCQGLSPMSVASELADDLANTLRTVREERKAAARKAEAEALINAQKEGRWRAVLLSLLFMSLILLSGWMHELLRRRIERSERVQDIRAGDATVLPREHVKGALRGLLSWTRLAVAVVLGIVWVQAVLTSLPGTRSEGQLIYQAILIGLQTLGYGIVAAIPGLVIIGIVLMVAQFMMRLFDYLMGRVKAGTLDLEPYLPRELGGFVQSIGRFFIVMVALFLIAPNIPGAGSDMAKLITVVAGFILSFSSTTTIGNVLAGLVITYMRPFRIGDRVKMENTVGDVVGSTLLYIRLRTIYNEDVLIPSMQVLNGHILNYSSAPEGVILHTSVSIGYGAPRETVERLLIEAALTVEACEKQPAPYVLVQGLDDFYVRYELQVYTKKPNRQHITYSEIHKAIKDTFDAAGVEIMSPHYYALRRGNEITIPHKDT